MPTRIQNLQREIKKAKEGVNIYDSLQGQVDLIVEYLVRTEAAQSRNRPTEDKA